MTICGDPWFLSWFSGGLSDDVFEGRRAWATKAIVDMDMCFPRRSSVLLVIGQNGGVGGPCRFHGCVSEIFCLLRVAPKHCGFSLFFLMLHGSEEASSSVVGLSVVVHQLVGSATVVALDDCGLFVPLLFLMMLDPDPFPGSEVK